jgi:hypothetical protein
MVSGIINTALLGGDTSITTLSLITGGGGLFVVGLVELSEQPLINEPLIKNNAKMERLTEVFMILFY